MVRKKKERFEFEAICFEADSSDPRYMQLERQVRQAISNGLLTAGSKVPSSRSLSKALGVSRNTVITAYNQLTSEGYLEPATGSGTRVATTLPESFELNSTSNISTNSEIGIDSLSTVGRKLAEESSLFPPSPIKAKPFLPHIPAVDAFPVEIWNRLSNEQARWSTKHLTLCEPQGYLPLRESLAEYMAISRGVPCSANQVIITSGGQQGAALVSQLLLEPNDTIWVEDPGNSPANRVFELAGAALEGVPLDEEGIDIRKAPSKKPPKLISVTPGGQWPLGMTMSLNRRLDLLLVAHRSKSWVLEDDYNGEFRYRGRPLPALCSLDKSGRTIYMGTFSKMLFPAIRLGFLIVPLAMAKTFAYAKWLQDRGSPSLVQMAMHRFIETGNFLKHIRRMRSLYARRQEVLYEGMKKHFGEKIQINRPESGMHLVVRGRTKKMEVQLIESAVRAKIQFHPVALYARNQRAESGRGMILGFAAYDTKSSQRAIRNWAREYSRS